VGDVRSKNRSRPRRRPRPRFGCSGLVTVTSREIVIERATDGTYGTDGTNVNRRVRVPVVQPNIENEDDDECEDETPREFITRFFPIVCAPGTTNTIPRSRKYRGSHGRAQVTR
jgi:hypothetical protein